jgi:hypothetical protein
MKQLIKITCISILTGIVISLSSPSFAQPMHQHHEWRERAPYGDYCPGSRWGWYGAKKRIRTLMEVRRILQEYFSDKDVRIGRIKEREWFFEAEIRDKDNNLIDIVIVDKRTGRIRSIY